MNLLGLHLLCNFMHHPILGKDGPYDDGREIVE